MVSLALPLLEIRPLHSRLDLTFLKVFWLIDNSLPGFLPVLISEKETRVQN